MRSFGTTRIEAAGIGLEGPTGTDVGVETINPLVPIRSAVSRYKAVLFDQDGVLVEPPTAEVQAAATRAAFREVGVEEPNEDHVDAVVNGVTVDQLQAICRTSDLAPETFWEARERHDERSQIERFEAGARTTYEDLEAIELLDSPCGVVSNNHDSTVGFVMDHFGLESLFEVAIGREKTIESLRLKKPNSHYLDRALDAIDDDGARTPENGGEPISPAEAIYVGDGESDLVAAHRAGVDSVLLRRSHNADLDPEPTPTYDVDSLHEVAAIVNKDEADWTDG